MNNYKTINNIAVKYILVFLLFATFSTSLSAQYYLIGMVRDSATFTGVPNRTVLISGANTSYANTLITDASGFFYDTLNVVSGQQKKFYVSTSDCNQNTVIDSVFSFTPGIAILDICTAGIPLCKADYSYYPTFSNYKKIHFINKSSITVDKYLWTFGDGTMSTLKNPFHTYSAPGTYLVCVNIVDTNAYCTDSYCDSVTVSVANSCSNSFITSINGLSVAFQGTVNNNHPTDYQWNYGDGSPNDFGQNTNHSFTHGGAFQVCLTSKSYNMQTMDTCISHSCQTVNVSGPPTINVWGQVFQGPDRADIGTVYLYRYNQTVSQYSLVDSVPIVKVDSLNLSYYYFESIPLGKYTTKAALSINSTYYNNFAPAYYGNTFHWNLAQQFDLHQAGYNFPINLSEIDALIGMAAISGKVMEGTAKAPGDPIAGIPLYLVDSDNQLLGFTFSNTHGDYSFSDLPYNKYFIYADLINYQTYPSTTTPYEGDKNKTGINIYIGKGMITGVSNKSLNLSSLKVFPNPAIDFIELQMDLKQEQIISTKLYNMVGSMVLEVSNKEYFAPGKHQMQIDLSSLPNGIYSLLVENNNKERKLIKVIVMR